MSGPEPVDDLLIYPCSLIPELREVLGLMIFDTSPLANLFRESNEAEIPREVEAEQAFVLDHLIRLVLKHGPDWRRELQKETQPLVTMVQRIRALRASAGKEEKDASADRAGDGQVV